MELVVQPHGGATALHTDRWVEVFHVLDGEVELRFGMKLCAAQG
jgi:quercetin dioxygenase-like cupin family protein